MNTNELVDDFREVARLAGVTIPANALHLDAWPAPHRPKGLPSGWMAVYLFDYNGRALKVGKAGPNSDARYRSHHYRVSSSDSNLARSLALDGARIGVAVTEESVGSWIREHTSRVNLLLKAELGIPLLTLAEAFLQCRLNPVFEGFETQRAVAVGGG